MAKKSVLCLVSTRVQAGHITEQLRAAGFPNNDISALFSNDQSCRELDYDRSLTPFESFLAGAVTNGFIAGVMGWAASHALSLSSFGVMVGAMIGASSGGITGCLIGRRMKITHCQGKNLEGDILLSVNATSDEQAQQAKSIFAEAGAVNVRTSENVHCRK